MEREKQSGIVEQARRHYVEYFANADAQQLRAAQTKTQAARERLRPLGECVSTGEFTTANVHFWAIGKLVAIDELLAKSTAPARGAVQQTRF